MIKVLIVDDSESVCRFLMREISKAPDIEVIGTAGDPYSARDKIVLLRPDVITLDLEMPRMDGLTFLGKLMYYFPMPVIVVSSYTPQGAQTTLRALELGALDVLEKPGPSASAGAFGKMLIERIRVAAQSRRSDTRQWKAPTPQRPQTGSVQFNPSYQVLAVGASLGGIEAIREFLQGLSSDSPGVLVVQHLPAAFIEQFAQQLDAACGLTVRTAKSGDPLTRGVALVAPGEGHMVLCKRDSRYYVDIKGGPPVRGHCPSVDVLFHSVAACAGPAAVGVLLTGMGDDGAHGLLAMRQAGARTFAQDEKSSIVFGMPKVAIDLQAAERVVSLSQMSYEVITTISLSYARIPTCPAQGQT